jgi:DNA-binding CsgD family transcriptional regulator
VTRRLIAEYVARPERRAASPASLGELTDREREVLGLIALGHTNGEMAKLLFLSLRTVETHRANIHRKLGTDSRAELVRHALELGLVKP